MKLYVPRKALKIAIHGGMEFQRTVAWSSRSGGTAFRPCRDTHSLKAVPPEHHTRR
jgi:hypothetical protein